MPGGRRLPKFLDAGELRMLLEAAEASGPRELALVVLMAYAGLRVSEACGLRFGDAGERQILVRQGKGGKDRLLPVHPRVRRALEALRLFYISRNEGALTPDPSPDARERGEVHKNAHNISAKTQDYVFPGARGQNWGQNSQPLTTRAAEYSIEALCSAAGIPREKAHPHTLRHTFATNLLRKTGNLILVQRSLGHSSVSTTQVYTHLVFDDLEEAVGQLD